MAARPGQFAGVRPGRPSPPVPHDRRRRRRARHDRARADLQAICSGDIAYNNIHMWLWNSTPDSRQAWLASLDAVAALKPSTIITGHKDPCAPDDNATRVLDQSRRYIEDFDQAVAKSSTPREVIDVMLAKYPAYGNRYTLCADIVEVEGSHVIMISSRRRSPTTSSRRHGPSPARTRRRRAPHRRRARRRRK